MKSLHDAFTAPSPAVALVLDEHVFELAIGGALADCQLKVFSRGAKRRKYINKDHPLCVAARGTREGADPHPHDEEMVDETAGDENSWPAKGDRDEHGWAADENGWAADDSGWAASKV